METSEELYFLEARKYVLVPPKDVLVSARRCTRNIAYGGEEFCEDESESSCVAFEIVGYSASE